jgi:hypothetical protein
VAFLFFAIRALSIQHSAKANPCLNHRQSAGAQKPELHSSPAGVPVPQKTKPFCPFTWKNDSCMEPFYPYGANMTRQEVRAAILALAEKLKQTPTIPELMKHAGIDRPEIRKHFGNYKQALEECNLEVPERGRKIELDRLFLDWAEVVRALKKIPTVFEYERRSKYSSRPLTRCAGSWNMVAERMKLYAEEHGLAGEFRDVLELVEAQPGGGQGGAAVSSTGVSAEASRTTEGQPPYLRGADRGLGTRLWSNKRGRSDQPVWSHGALAGLSDTEDTDGVSGLRSATGGWERPEQTGEN